jgi:metal-sulfur cluster biosynthetic enzyme
MVDLNSVQGVRNIAFALLLLIMPQITNSDVIKALSGCVDPEIGINIIDLGLVHWIKIDSANNVDIRMTMTSPMCPVTSVILADAQLRIERIQGIGNVNIELVWEPAWSPEMISEEARLNLQV